MLLWKLSVGDGSVVERERDEFFGGSVSVARLGKNLHHQIQFQKKLS